MSRHLGLLACVTATGEGQWPTKASAWGSPAQVNADLELPALLAAGLRTREKDIALLTLKVPRNFELGAVETSLFPKAKATKSALQKYRMTSAPNVS